MRGDMMFEAELFRRMSLMYVYLLNQLCHTLLFKMHSKFNI